MLPEQPELPGVEIRIPEIHNLALEYRAVRDEHRRCTAQLKKLKDDLLAAMKEHELEHYNCEGLDARIVHESERVKVTIEKEDLEDAAGEAA
jgi:hypothetical protein